jgi:hypothetical protein
VAPFHNPTGIGFRVLIVDAFNVLHASVQAGLGRIDTNRLKALISHSHWGTAHVVLVFDGSGGPRAPGRGSLRRAAEAGLELESRGSGISEIYAGGGADRESTGGLDADAVIESLLEREERMGRGRQATVVSSDKRVRAAATGARAKSIGSEEFLKRLAEDVRKAHERAKRKDGGRPGFATDEGADSGRTEYWLREFGLDGARGRGKASARGGKRGDHSKSLDDAAPAGDRHSEDWRTTIDADDLDMARILRQHPPNKASRDEDDEDRSKTPRPRRS